MKDGLAVGDELGPVVGKTDLVGERDGEPVFVGEVVGGSEGDALGPSHSPQAIRQFARAST